MVAVTCASTSEQIIWVLWGNAALLGSQASLSPLTPLTLPFGPLSQAEGSGSLRQRRDVKQGLSPSHIRESAGRPCLDGRHSAASAL